MSTGSASIPLLKAAPEPDQLADRLDGGPWRGIELCLAGAHIADAAALERAVEVAKEALHEGMAVTAEAPVAWPSGGFVRVDRLDDEARAGIERSADFAAAIGSPVLTIHLFAPISPEEYRAGEPLDTTEVERFLRFYAAACGDRGVTPLIENVPPVLRMRTGGVFLSPIGGHWRDLLAWREAVPELGFTFDTSHAALFRNFAAAYPTLLGSTAEEGELGLDRFVEELGPAADVAHVSDASGLLGEGLPYGHGELDLDPVVARLGQLVQFIVAEINEPDHARSESMKAGYRAIERALGQPAGPPSPSSRRAGRAASVADPFDWQSVLGRRDPVPALLELEERFAGRRVLVTGGGGSIGRGLVSFLAGFRPERISMLDAHERALAEDRRERDAATLERIDHVLCDVRDPGRLQAEMARAAPDVVFHMAAYKHVDWAERYPEEFVATNLQGSWNVLSAAEAAGVQTVVVASTDKAALAASLYGKTKRLMEQLTALAGERIGADRLAVRLVNVLGSAGSASDLFLRQARSGAALTVTDTGMVRYWITMAHAVTLMAQGTLLAAGGVRLAGPADPVTMTVGELATRIWREAGHEDDPQLDLVGVRPGETMSEVITAPGERIGKELHQGSAPIEGPEPPAEVEELVARVAEATEEERRAVWLQALAAAERTAPMRR